MNQLLKYCSLQEKKTVTLAEPFETKNFWQIIVKCAESLLKWARGANNYCKMKLK